MYIRMMGAAGPEAGDRDGDHLAPTTSRLGSRAHFPLLYKGRHGRVAHECILDTRVLKDERRHQRRGYRQAADRLRLPRADHVVAGRRHADGRADGIRAEARARPLLRGDDRDRRRGREGRRGRVAADDNPLANAPHTAAEVLAGEWTAPLFAARRRPIPPATRTLAAKYWPPVSRIDNVAGDRNLVCSCPPVSEYLARRSSFRAYSARFRRFGGSYCRLANRAGTSSTSPASVR